MSTMGRPRSYSPELCELAHNDCLLGATDDEVAEFFGVIDDIALLDAVGESVRHAGDRAGARPLGEMAKPAAERAERAETSNPWEIAAFSTTARGGGNRRKLAETPVETCSGNCPLFCCLTHGVQSMQSTTHRLRKLRKFPVPAGNDTAATRLL